MARILEDKYTEIFPEAFVDTSEGTMCIFDGPGNCLVFNMANMKDTMNYLQRIGDQEQVDACLDFITQLSPPYMEQ